MHIRTVLPRIGTFAGIALVLVACSSSSSSPTDPSAEASFPSGSEVEVGSHQLINSERNRAGLRPLELDEKLSAVAREHSRNMREQGFFDHVDSRGRDFRDRARAAGVSFVAVAENLAKISSSTDPAQMAHAQMMKSPRHRTNIMNGRFNAIGIGVAVEGETYWITQLFIEE